MTARLIKDCMNNYAIEVLRGTKWVYCIVRMDGRVEHKRYTLKRHIVDHVYSTRDGTYLYDQRWSEVPTIPVANAARTFMHGMLPVTPKALRLLRAIRDNETITEESAAEELLPDVQESEMT